MTKTLITIGGCLVVLATLIAVTFAGVQWQAHRNERAKRDAYMRQLSETEMVVKRVESANAGGFSVAIEKAHDSVAQLRQLAPDKESRDGTLNMDWLLDFVASCPTNSYCWRTWEDNREIAFRRMLPAK